jgi:hypothetical protein
LPDTESVRAAVRRAERRLKLSCLAADVATAVQVSLALVLLVELLSIPLPPMRRLVPWILAAGIGASAIARAVVLTRRRWASRSAFALDRAAGLRDELWTAHWFLERGGRTPWVDELTSRASASAASLDIGRLMPLRLRPGQAGRTVALAAGVLILALLPLDRIGAWLMSPPPLAWSAEDRARLDRIAETLDQPEAVGDAATRARVEALLERLRSGDLSLEETLAVIAELRRLVGEADSPAEWRASLDRVAAALRSADPTRSAGEAAGAGRLDEAAGELRNLAATLSDEASDRLRAALDQAGREGAPGALGEHLRAAAEAMRQGRPDLARQHLEAAAEDLREMARGADRAELGRQADRQLEELERAFGERFRSPGASERAVERQQRQPLSSEDLSPEGATPMSGTGEGKAVPGSGDAKPGSTTARGDVSSPMPGRGAPVRTTGAIQPLGDAVRKRLELLAAGKATGEAPGRDEIDEDTRASRVTVPYRPVAPRAPYADAESLEGDVVPWSYRALVRSYFEVLGPRGSREK